MGEIADWMIEQMMDIDGDYVIRHMFPPVLTIDSLPFPEQRQVWKWKTKDNHTYKLCELTDTHIMHIIPYMERRKTERELPDEKLRSEWIKRCNKTIKLMKQEQSYRKKHHITVEDKPVMKVVHHDRHA